MESKKILIISFLSAATIFFSGCHSQNLNNDFGNTERKEQKQCKCGWNADTATIPYIISQYQNPTDVKNNYKRQIIYVYKDLLNNVIVIHIPNSDKQKIIPDAPVEDNDVLITLTNETVNDLFLKNPEHVTLENAVPRLQTIDMANFIEVPEKDTLQNQLKSLNYFNSYIDTLAQNFKLINPIGSNHYPATLYSNDIVTLEMPKFGKDFGTGSHASIPHPHTNPSSDINPVNSGKQESVVPINFSEHFWPVSHVSVPNTQPFNPSKPVYAGKKEPIEPINFTEGFWPGSHMSVPHSHILNPSKIKLIDSSNKPCHKCKPMQHLKKQKTPYVIQNQYLEPSNAPTPPYMYLFRPSDFNPVDSAEKAPDHSAELPHLYTFHPRVIKPIYSGEQEPKYSVEIPHSHPLNISEISLVDYGELEPSQFLEILNSHPNDIKLVDSTEEPSQSVEEPYSNLSDIKLVDSGEQTPSLSVEEPDSDPSHLKPLLDFDEKAYGYSVEALDSHPSDIKLVDSGKQEPNLSLEVPDSDLSDIKTVDFGKQEPDISLEKPDIHPSDVNAADSEGQEPNNHMQVPVEIQPNEQNNNFDKFLPGEPVTGLENPQIKNPCFNCKPMKHYKMEKSPRVTHHLKELKRPINLNIHPKAHYIIPVTNLRDKYKKRKDSLAYMGYKYKTFDKWFREEMHIFKNNNQKVNVNLLGIFILKILHENDMFVTDGGVLNDSQGKILYMQNLKLRPVLIGKTMSLENLFESDSSTGFTDPDKSAWSEMVILSMLYPPKILGVIPLGKTNLPFSSGLNLLSLFKSRDESKRSNIAKKRYFKGQSPFSLIPHNDRYKRYLKSDPIKITEGNLFNPEHKLNQNMKNDVSKDGASKNENENDESVEKFLENMPVYSFRRKGYVNKHDLNRETPLHLNDALIESSKISMNGRFNIPKKHSQRLKNLDSSNYNDGSLDNDLTRIIGGTAATGSGAALNNKGRSGVSQKLHNHGALNHGSNNLKKYDYKTDYDYLDYINWNDLYDDDSLLRIIGGNAATGSGSPLSNKGRSGAPY